MNLKRIEELHEVRDLEPLVIQNLEKIEVGLKVLENQLSIGVSGRPDILAVDKDGALVVMELKSITADSSAIGQIVRYYEWFAGNLALAARPFAGIKLDKGIRLLVVAPEFEEDAVLVAGYLNLHVSLIRYIVLQDTATEAIGIVFETLALKPIEPIEVELRSLEDISSYFADESLKVEFQKVLNDLMKSGAKLTPYNGGKDHWIECAFNEEPIAYLQPRQRYFNCQIYDEGADKWVWPPHKMVSYEQWSRECRSEIVKWIQEGNSAES